MAGSPGMPMLVPVPRPAPRRCSRRLLQIAAVAAGLALMSVLPLDGSAAFVTGRATQLRQPGGEPSRLPAAPLRANPNFWGLYMPIEKKPSVIRKIPYIHATLLNKITRMNKEGTKETVQTWRRSSTIIPAMIGHTVAVHNGREFVPLTIVEGMVGYKLDNFVLSKKPGVHTKQNKRTAYRRKVKGGAVEP